MQDVECDQKQSAELRKLANDTSDVEKRYCSNLMQWAAKASIEYQEAVDLRIDLGSCLHIIAGGSMLSSAMANMPSSTWDPSASDGMS